MGKITVRTNYHWRDPLYGYELTAAERDEFAYLEDSDESDTGEFGSHEFFRYRGCVYDAQEFFVVPAKPEGWSLELGDEFYTWHGYQSDSYFSGIVIRWSEDFEQYQIGTYYA